LAQPIVATREPSFKQVNLKKYRKRFQWALIPRYPSHIASNAAICWMLFGLRCWSWSPYLNSTPRMNRPAGTEKLRSWKTTNDTTNPLGARHGLIAGDLPLDGGGERGKLAHLDETEKLLAGNVGACPVRHHDGGVSGGLEAQEVVALRMRKNSESRVRGQEEEDDGKAKSPEPAPDVRF
jgi:hypothetical protein